MSNSEKSNNIYYSDQGFNACKFNAEIMNIAYSSIGLAPINTAEHYRLAAHLGFNTLKGDVRITSDGGLIMCHDAGFTLDSNGRIGKFNRESNKAILDSTYDYLISLEYAADYDNLGHYSKVCNFDTFIRICKENGKTAFVTLRENNPEQLVYAVMETLRKYHMENHCVINSFTYKTLAEVRKYTSNIPLSLVLPHKKVLQTSTVDGMLPLSPALITLFFYPAENALEFWDESADAIAYAEEKGIQLHMAQVGKYSDYCDMVKRGVQGFHITKPFFPYTKTNIQFKITLDENGATFGNILCSDRLTADISLSNGVAEIHNIACNGSGYGYDDGLPALWLNKLPFTATSTHESGTVHSLTFKNNALLLDTNNIPGAYFIDVNI